MKALRRNALKMLAGSVAVGALPLAAPADLLLYDPFDYTAGDNLGGTDPDGGGPTVGTPVGKTNLNTGGGTWYARGVASNYQAPNDTLINAGNLAYNGLALSAGNSVSYGSNVGSSALFADAIDIPGADITSGSLYASFIIRIKNAPTTLRHSPVGFVTDVSDAGNAGLALASGSGTATTMPGGLFMRRDPINGTTVTGFSPNKSSGDGIGPGATGPSSGWQHSTGGVNVESNQFGAVTGQAFPNFADSNTWQTYFVVMKYEFDTFGSPVNGQNDTVSLWMNPGSGTLAQANGEVLASANPGSGLGSYYAAVDAFGTATADVTAIRSLALIGHRQNTTETIAVDFDELRIGTTWAEVTPSRVRYWDIDGATAGAGGTAPAGNWDGLTANFNSDTAGGAGIITATPAATDTIVFGAGTGATGSYIVNVSATRSAAQVAAEEGDVTLTGGTVDTGSFNISTGASMTVESDVTGGTGDSLTKQGGGTLTVTAVNSFTGGVNVQGGTLAVTQGIKGNGPLSIAGGATAVIPEATPNTYNPPTDYPSGSNTNGSLVSSISIVGTGVLDLGNSDMAIDYVDPNSPLDDVRDYLAAGFNGGGWDGTGGIITNTLNANNPNQLDPSVFGLGYAENGALPAPYGTLLGGPLFSGEDVDDTTVLLKFTWIGDLNLDGFVDFQDLSVFNTNYDNGATSGRYWFEGDFNYDGFIDFGDLSLFNTNYDPSKPSLPEPGSATLLVIGAAAAATSRRRRRR